MMAEVAVDISPDEIASRIASVKMRMAGLRALRIVREMEFSDAMRSGYFDLDAAERKRVDAIAEQLCEYDAKLIKARGEYDILRRHLAFANAEKQRHQEVARASHVTPNTVAHHHRWRDWKHSTGEYASLPVPVTETTDDPASVGHVLVDDVDRRARAMLSWSPWERRRRHSRRYEGYSRG